MGQWSRRRFLRWALGSAAAVCAGGPAYAFLVEPRWLDLEEVTVSLPGLARHLDGFRLVFVSDLHHGPEVSQGEVARAVNQALAVSPDLILLGGDYVSESADFAAPCAEELARLRAPHGVFGCLGNHDHWTDAEVVTATLSEAGVRVLRNEGVEIANGLWLAAVDDIWEQQADLDAALAGAPTGAVVLLLAHEPDYADQVATDGRVALQLSGHSHGGQVRLPLLGPPVLPYLAQRYAAGLYGVGRMQLYVTRGVGRIAPAVRFNCRPEVTLLTLRSEP